MRHHALADFKYLSGMATAATDVRDAEVTRIHKANELGVLMIE
jgi:hypothetical protein